MKVFVVRVLNGLFKDTRGIMLADGLMSAKKGLYAYQKLFEEQGYQLTRCYNTKLLGGTFVYTKITDTHTSNVLIQWFIKDLLSEEDVNKLSINLVKTH